MDETFFQDESEILQAAEERRQGLARDSFADFVRGEFAPLLRTAVCAKSQLCIV